MTKEIALLEVLEPKASKELGELLEWGPNFLKVDEEATFEQFGQIITFFDSLLDVSNWYLGDALNQMNHKHGEKFQDLKEATGMTHQHYGQLEKVAREYPIETRVSELSWTHHRAASTIGGEHRKRTLETAKVLKLSTKAVDAIVVKCPPNARLRLLTKAVSEQWDSQQVMEACQEKKQAAQPKPEAPEDPQPQLNGEQDHTPDYGPVVEPEPELTEEEQEEMLAQNLVDELVMFSSSVVAQFRGLDEAGAYREAEMPRDVLEDQYELVREVKNGMRRWEDQIKAKLA